MSAVVLEIYLLRKGLRLVDEGITLRLAFAKFDHLQDILLLITFRKTNAFLINRRFSRKNFESL